MMPAKFIQIRTEVIDGVITVIALDADGKVWTYCGDHWRQLAAKRFVIDQTTEPSPSGS